MPYDLTRNYLSFINSEWIDKKD